MRALEAMPGLRVVARPEALDGAPWGEESVALRFAPDDAFVIGVSGGWLAGRIADDHAIVEPETGFVGTWLNPHELAEAVEPHIEWPLPAARPAFAQGLIAGVPAKLWLEDDRALLLCAAAYAHELTERLG
ncbi:MAG: hypothetical protein M3395_06040 [Chloroflexota bacterium]|nr:hypothetical protein [Chloroflexota bacterium]